MSTNFNPVDVSGQLEVPVNPEAPKVEPVAPAPAEPNAKPEGDAAPPEKKDGEEGDEGEDEDEFGVAMDPEFQELRETMIKAGVDFTEMDTKFRAGEDIGDENIALIAKHSGYKEGAVRSWVKLKQDSMQLVQIKNTEAKAAKEAFLAQVNESAGGDYKVLKQWVFENVPQEKVKIWNAAMKTADPETQIAAIKEMHEYRAQKSDTVVSAKPKKADLSLLTKAGSGNAATAPSAPSTDTLAGNPMASHNLQDLCLIKTQGPAHPQYEKAIEVLRVRAPHLV